MRGATLAALAALAALPSAAQAESVMRNVDQDDWISVILQKDDYLELIRFESGKALVEICGESEFDWQLTIDGEEEYPPENGECLTPDPVTSLAVRNPNFNPSMVVRLRYRIFGAACECGD